ncbi:MAG: RNA methyltransferase [Chloroflexota bacterium]|nr:MAG: RNA methyltransferase [Chloroflexota bacterium]
MITSLQNDRVKQVYALQRQAKARRKQQRIVLEGARLIADAYERGNTRPEYALYDPDTADAGLVDLLQRGRVPSLPVSAQVLRHISATEQPQGIVAVFPMPSPALPETLTRVLILDDLRDPGNLGTILRTTAAAGIDAVLLSPGCVDPYNPKALRAGMGAHFRLSLAEKSWSEIEALCRGLNIYLADMTGDAPYDRVEWTAPWALIIGSEAHGASPQAEALATKRIYIPMADNAESLNAAVATGILLFEARRQASAGNTQDNSRQ